MVSPACRCAVGARPSQQVGACCLLMGQCSQTQPCWEQTQERTKCSAELIHLTPAVADQAHSNILPLLLLLALITGLSLFLQVRGHVLGCPSLSFYGVGVLGCEAVRPVPKVAVRSGIDHR